MHMTILVIVYAHSGKDALEKAEDRLDNLCGDYKPFDYFTKLAPMKADSGRGKELIAEAMDYTKREFMRNLRTVRAFMKLSDEELFEDKEFPVDQREPDLYYNFRYCCHNLGRTRGPSIWIYDDDNEGVRDEEHLHSTLTKYACLYEDQGKVNPHADKTVWVVPADVHF
jgi:hypothetical protein